MKKIPKSITVTVRNGDEFRASRPGRTYYGEGVEYEGVLGSFPDTPLPPYRVTYLLDERGTLLAEADDPFINVCRLRGGHLVTTCFLPLSWDGKRVSRRVEKVKK